MQRASKTNHDEILQQKAYRHTTAHILAQAVKRLYPDAKLAIGPAIEDGFYYDVQFSSPLSPEDLPALEKEMAHIIAQDFPLEHFTLSREEALQLMRQRDEPYKLQLIEDLPDDEVLHFYRQGEFVDLCAGPHVASTGAIHAFRLLSIAGAYWRGNEKTPCSPEFTVPALKLRPSWMPIWKSWRKPKRGITASWARSLDFLHLWTRARGFPFFFQKV